MTSRSLKFVVVLGLMVTLFIGGKPSGTEAASSNLITPTSGPVTSEYGARWGTFHHGIDYGNVRGTQVIASADGVVTRASGGCYEGNTSCNGGFGNVIYIQHVLSSGEVYTTVYAHLNSINISVNQTVSQGQVIGTLGHTGDSTGPHLHFEVHQGNFSRSPSNSINPRNVLNDEYVQASYRNPYAGIGEATSKYPDGYGINVYNAPGGTYVGVITKKIPYVVNLERDGWLNIGNNQWVQAAHMNYKRYTAASKYSAGLGVNLYSGPNGTYVGRIYAPTAYRVYYYSDGWVDLGNSHWVKAEHLIIK